MEAIINNNPENKHIGIDAIEKVANKAFVETFTYNPYVPEDQEQLYNGREDEYFPDENNK